MKSVHQKKKPLTSSTMMMIAVLHSANIFVGQLLLKSNKTHPFIHFIVGYDSNPLADDVVTSTHRSRQQRRDVSGFEIDSNPNNGYTIEVLVVVDKSMQTFHRNKGSNVIEYVSLLMSKTADMFAHTTIGNMIDIAVVGIEENLYVKKGNVCSSKLT